MVGKQILACLLAISFAVTLLPGTKGQTTLATGQAVAVELANGAAAPSPAPGPAPTVSTAGRKMLETDPLASQQAAAQNSIGAGAPAVAGQSGTGANPNTGYSGSSVGGNVANSAINAGEGSNISSARRGPSPAPAPAPEVDASSTLPAASGR